MILSFIFFIIAQCAISTQIQTGLKLITKENVAKTVIAAAVVLPPLLALSLLPSKETAIELSKSRVERLGNGTISVDFPDSPAVQDLQKKNTNLSYLQKIRGETFGQIQASKEKYYNWFQQLRSKGIVKSQDLKNLDDQDALIGNGNNNTEDLARQNFFENMSAVSSYEADNLGYTLCRFRNIIQQIDAITATNVQWNEIRDNWNDFKNNLNHDSDFVRRVNGFLGNRDDVDGIPEGHEEKYNFFEDNIKPVIDSCIENAKIINDGLISILDKEISQLQEKIEDAKKQAVANEIAAIENEMTAIENDRFWKLKQVVALFKEEPVLLNAWLFCVFIPLSWLCYRKYLAKGIIKS